MPDYISQALTAGTGDLDLLRGDLLPFSMDAKILLCARAGHEGLNFWGLTALAP